ncbi:MAG: YHS domain-containing (seleno)protein [Saprospiraceae bacterium]|nr:YHS domain-containing (seleno)protein [Saprospiraceae bacterium]
MNNFFFLCLSALLIVGAASASAQQTPNLGKVVDGYLVNVDENGVILHGHDPVSLREGHDTAGSPDISLKHKGAVYQFANVENKKKFQANPALYEPRFGGYCAYGLAVGNLAPIELWTYDTTFKGLNLYQHNQKAVDGWVKDVPGNYTKAEKTWAKFTKKFTGKKYK